MRRSLPRDEHGSVTIWLALASFAMIVLVGLAVDLSGQVYAQQRAHDVAASAARVAGQQVDSAAGMRGTAVRTNAVDAASAARGYVASSGLAGEVTAGGTAVTVTVRSAYTTKFLSIVGISHLPVTARAEARVVRVVAGAER